MDLSDHPRAGRQVPIEREHGQGAVALGGAGQHHALRGDAHELGRLQVGDHDDLLAHQVRRRVVLGDAGHHGAPLGPERDGELQQLLRLGHRLGRHHLGHPQLDLAEVGDADRPGRRRRRHPGAGRRLAFLDPREEAAELLHGRQPVQASERGVVQVRGIGHLEGAADLDRRLGHEGLEHDAEPVQPVGQRQQDAVEAGALVRAAGQRPGLGGVDVAVERSDEFPDGGQGSLERELRHRLVE